MAGLHGTQIERNKKHAHSSSIANSDGGKWWWLVLVDLMVGGGGGIKARDEVSALRA